MAQKSRTRTAFVCQNCGAHSPRWQGHCHDCDSWNSFVEEQLAPRSAVQGFVLGPQEESLVPLDQVEGLQQERVPTDLPELDRVLGGGLVPGAVVLLGGAPGIGKSTLLLQLAHKHAKKSAPIMYVSGEESPQQIRLRADRLNCNDPGILLLNTTRFEAVEEKIATCSPKLVLVDSVQTLYRSDLSSAPGSVTQVRECAAALMRIAKQSGVPVVLVGHVTKEGGLAGPRVLEHLVDTVLSFEGDDQSQVRTLRASKNRFGSTHELGLFEMGPNGLTSVAHPSSYFLKDRRKRQSGTIVYPTLEGTRPILVEIQALVTESYAAAQGAPPTRRSVGLDGNRLSLLLAVLGKRLRGQQGFAKSDVYTKVAGGLNLHEPALDLALALALLSSRRDVSLPTRTAAFGEIGLGGEIRSVPGTELRLRELARLGFIDCALPASHQSAKSELKIPGLQLHFLETVEELPTFLTAAGRREDNT